jgi:hypothetical protein
MIRVCGGAADRKLSLRSISDLLGGGAGVGWDGPPVPSVMSAVACMNPVARLLGVRGADMMG